MFDLSPRMRARFRMLVKMEQLVNPAAICPSFSALPISMQGENCVEGLTL